MHPAQQQAVRKHCGGPAFSNNNSELLLLLGVANQAWTLEAAGGQGVPVYHVPPASSLLTWGSVRFRVYTAYMGV